MSATAAAPHARLKPEQVAQYRSEGYAIFNEPVLPEAKFHVVYLARGRALGGNTYANPTRSYPEVMEKRGISGQYKSSH